MKNYETIEIQIFTINTRDIITTSPADKGFNSDGDNNWEW